MNIRSILMNGFLALGGHTKLHVSGVGEYWEWGCEWVKIVLCIIVAEA